MKKRNVMKADKTAAQASAENDAKKVIEAQKLIDDQKKKKVDEFSKIVKEASERLGVAISPLAVVPIGQGQSVNIPLDKFLNCQIVLQAIAK